MSKKEEKKAKKAAKKANKKPMDTSVKSALITAVCAILCVAIVAISLSNGIQKIAETNLKIAENAAQGVSGDAGTDDTYSTDSGVSTDDTYVDSSTDDTNVDVDAVVDDPAANVDTPADTPSQGGTQAPTQSNAQGNTGSKAPSSVADVLSYYNTATKKVVDNKVLFSKERSSVEKSYEAGLALNTFKGLVYQFMGVGDENKYSHTVTADETKDSYHKYFLASKLTASDVKSAKCVDSNGTYTITISLKDGASSVENGSVVKAGNTPLDKCGISAGENDKDYWDHKNAQNVYSAISSVAEKANIKESYSNATLKAVINSKTGNLTSLTVSFDFKFDISNIMGSKGVATGKSTVVMKGFKW